jgi:hypothetical protein
MRLKIYIVTSLISFLTISCQECNKKLNDHVKNTKPHQNNETYKYDQTPLTGHIDIFKHNGENYNILIEQILCNPTPNILKPNQEQNEQEKRESSPYIIKLEPGEYQIKLYDKLHHHTYTRYITIGLKHNTD